MQSLANILRLTLKELRAIRGDRVMMILIVYVFTVATYIVADAISTEISDLSVAVVDEDQSTLSHRLTDAIRPPLFRQPAVLTPEEARRDLRASDYVLVVSIPPDFQRDIDSGRTPTLLILVDATAVAHAGNGAAFMRQLLAQEVARFVAPGNTDTGAMVDVVFRNLYNPNLTSTWFSSVMQLMNDIAILTLILSGASLIREREHGTIEHVLVMPVRPHEIVLSKMAANGAVILAAAVLSLTFVVRGLIGVPVAGSVPLFVGGTAIYVIAVASIGLLLSTFTHSMGQFGLLVIPVIIVMILLSGGMTPLESMPVWLRSVMEVVSPAPHFVRFAQSVLYRGSGFSLVAGEMAAMALMACAALTLVLFRFRKVLAG